LRALDQLFGPLGLNLAGGHGAELRRWHDGSAEELRAAPLDSWIRNQGVEIAAAHGDLLIEDKGYSIAIHYRLAPEQETAVRDAAAAILADAPAGTLELLHGKAVVEIKRAGFNKGTAVRVLMSHAPFAGRRPIFVGDDVTDEDAFAVMPEFDGIALTVGRTTADAARRFESPAEVRRWIEQLCHAGT